VSFTPIFLKKRTVGAQKRLNYLIFLLTCSTSDGRDQLKVDYWRFMKQFFLSVEQAAGLPVHKSAESGLRFTRNSKAAPPHS